MITLYHAPRTRSLRIIWLLEELGIPYELETVGFAPPARPFTQQTPTGKFPTLTDGEITIFESAAIGEYLVERYGNGRLAPAIGTPARGRKSVAEVPSPNRLLPHPCQMTVTHALAARGNKPVPRPVSRTNKHGRLR